VSVILKIAFTIYQKHKGVLNNSSANYSFSLKKALLLQKH